MELKQSMKVYLREHPDSEFIIELCFSLSDSTKLKNIEWENNHEFWYNDEMFDLIEKKTVNNQLILRCINDDEETNLVKLQQRINKEKQDDTSSKNRSARILQLIQKVFIIADIQVVESFVSKPDFSSFKESFLLPVLREVLTPPPQQG